MEKKIKVSVFNDLKKAPRDAATYERGESVNLRVTRIPSRETENPIAPYSRKADESRFREVGELF